MNPAQTAPSPSGIEFSIEGHYFTAQATEEELDAAIRTIARPLSVIYQVTRRCNFDCDFCSETARVKDPTLEEIARIQNNLRGVQRVFLSGGEPLLRKDFLEIVSIFEEHIIGVPTNATRGHALAD
jgi:molybdenum cofactor biosynthesis enzyme MoaA